LHRRPGRRLAPLVHHLSRKAEDRHRAQDDVVAEEVVPWRKGKGHRVLLIRDAREPCRREFRSGGISSRRRRGEKMVLPWREAIESVASCRIGSDLVDDTWSIAWVDRPNPH